MIRFVLFVAATVLLVGATHAGDPQLPVLLSDDFTKGADNWQPGDANAWKIVKSDKGTYYSQYAQSKVKTPHRSPFNFSLIKDMIVGDFILEAKCQSTAKDVPHRDMCLFFGYQDPAHHYYVHIAKAADDNANQIFIVNAADRKKISTKSTTGTKWTDGWHHVKVLRTVADGKIEIYFDDMKTPIMTATDKNFTWGQVGIGSFDDTGNWKDVTLRGVRMKK